MTPRAVPPAGPPASILAVEIGEDRACVALVDGARVLAEAEAATPPGAPPEARADAALRAAAPWAGSFGRVAATAGLVSEGRWLPAGPAAPPDEGFPLAAYFHERLRVPATALGGGQAAAWAEHRLGAGRGAGDMILVVLGTGIAGGIVVGGRLLRGRGGLAGQLGAVLPILGARYADIAIEDGIAGRWIEAKAAQMGHRSDAGGVLAASAAGADWARAVVLESARRTVRVLVDLQLVLAPERIVLGGPLGLAPGHLDRIEALLEDHPAARRPHLALAELGRHAALLGAADLARREAREEAPGERADRRPGERPNGATPLPVRSRPAT